MPTVPITSRNEVERAVHHGIPIAPIRIQDALPAEELEYFLSSSHWMDALTPPFERHLQQLAAKTRALLEMQGQTLPAAPNLAPAATTILAPIPRRRLLVPALPRRCPADRPGSLDVAWQPVTALV